MASNRRDFLKQSAAMTLAGLTGSRALLAKDAQTTSFETTSSARQASLAPVSTANDIRRGDMIYRTLGSTGERVSMIGLGGFHIGKQKNEQESLRIIRTAIDRGVTFMDNCWDYNDGTSEVRMGKALQSGYREKVFLMTKIDGRTKAAASHQIEQSLQRLQTDHIDLLQFHEIIRLEDPDRIFADGGAFEAVQAARQAGKIRHVGFTGHKDPMVHLRMLDMAAQHGFHFDSVQMPINVMDAHFRSFERQVMPRVVREKTGVLAMKTFGDPFILEHMQKSHGATAIELLHYSMSRPVSVVITGIDSLRVLDQALEAVRTFKPPTKVQVASLLNRTRLAAASGKYEKFKTTPHFDGTAKNPQWLG